MNAAIRCLRPIIPIAVLGITSAFVLTPAACSQSSPQRPLPQRIVYEALFRHVVFLQQQANLADQQGQDGTPLRNFYQVRGNLTAAQAASLNQIAQSASTALQAAETQIRAQVKALRAQLPKPTPGAPPPPPPPILKTLQAQKDAAIMDQVSALYAVLGPTKFQQFDTFVQATVAPHITVTVGPPAGH